MFTLQTYEENNSFKNWTFQKINKIKNVFQSFKVHSQLIKCEQLSTIWLITLKNCSPSLLKLNSKWIITLKQYIQVKIQLADNQKIFNYDDFNIRMPSLIRDINSKSKGVYCIDPQTNKLLICRYKIHRFHDQNRTYLEANLKQIFNQVSFEFHNYVINANLIKGEKPISVGINQNNLRLNHLKQYFQWQRQGRQKSTCVNLSNFQIKNITEYSQIIETVNRTKSTASIKIYNRQTKVSKQKCLKYRNTVWNRIYGILKNQINKLSSGVADSISIKKIISQQIIDSGGFSQIYLGFYQLTYMLTCNMNSINDLIFVQEEDDEQDRDQNHIVNNIQFRKELIRKLPKPYIEAFKESSKSLSNQMKQEEKSLQKRRMKEEVKDISFNNQRQVIKYLRNAKIPFLAKYYIPTNSVDPAFQNGIYVQYYPYNLAKAKQVLKHHQLFKIFKQILMGIYVLWQNKLLHRDLKELNIMVNNDSNAKIIDLGSCCPMISQKKTDTNFVKSNIFFKDSDKMESQNKQMIQIRDIKGQPSKQQNLTVNKILISTQGYYFPYSSIKTSSLKQKYTKQQFNQASNFDMYAIGTMITKLFDLDIVQDTLYNRQLVYLASKCTQINPQDRYNPSEALCYIFQIHSLFLSEMQINSNAQNVQNLNIR